MSSSLYDPDRRYRRRQLRALLRLLFWLAVLGGVAVLAYQIGQEEARGRTDRVAEERDSLRTALQAAERAATEAAAARETAQQAAGDWEARYQRDVPTGALSDLTALVDGALAAGASPDRLAFLIRHADEPIDCEALASRRFILPTPLYRGPNTTVSFADGQVIVTGLGQNGVRENGDVETAFDPAQPVTIDFTMVDGTADSVEGRLPLVHSVRLGGDEYRFAIREDNPSFVSVAGERCPLPDARPDGPAAAGR